MQVNLSRNALSHAPVRPFWNLAWQTVAAISLLFLSLAISRAGFAGGGSPETSVSNQTEYPPKYQNDYRRAELEHRNRSTPPVYVMLGPPGAGKGTQSELLRTQLEIPAISTGDLFRELAAQEGSRAEIFRKILKEGGSPSDELLEEVLYARLSQSDCAQGFILDGCPRTLGHLKVLQKVLDRLNLSLTQVISLEVSSQVARGRMSGRVICQNCKAVYHEMNHSPKLAGQCDRCHSSLMHREDDQNPWTVTRRLDHYAQSTTLVLELFAEQGVLCRVEAQSSIPVVFHQVIHCIETSKKNHIQGDNYEN